MVEIFIDGDSCPVKNEVIKVAERHKIQVHLVSNGWFRIDHPLVNRVLVEQGPDVADNWIAERAGLGDIVITADIPLASRCIKNKAQVINTVGKLFTEDSIGMTLAMRNLMTHLRETGEITSGSSSFSAKDRSKFLSTLETAVQTAKKISK
jgi:uncharacterized protein YaiI (UPF0178 family)